MTNFEPWLRRLAAAQLRVDSIPPAFRALKWQQPIEIDGDWTGSTLEGSLSLEPNGAPIATFAITGPVVAGGVSTWTASLAAGTGANSTGALFTANDSDGDGIVDLAAMFRLTPSGGSKAVLMGGVFTVLEQA